jgi:hypothetical protein
MYMLIHLLLEESLCSLLLIIFMGPYTNYALSTVDHLSMMWKVG